jgi:hypothetical protein
MNSSRLRPAAAQPTAQRQDYKGAAAAGLLHATSLHQPKALHTVLLLGTQHHYSSGLAPALQITSAMSSDDVFQDWDVVESLWSHAFT